MALAAGLGWYAATHLSVNTDTTDMIDPATDFRREHNAFIARFGHLREEIIAIVEAPSPEFARENAQALVARLEAQPTAFQNVRYTAGLPYFRNNGLLFLPVPELEALIDRLAEAQPFLAPLAADPSAASLFALIERAISARLEGEATDDDIARLGPLIAVLADALERFNAGGDATVSWETLLRADGDLSATSFREIVTLEPVLDPDGVQPAARAISALRAAGRDIGLARFAHTTAVGEPASEATLALTGEPVLAHEELGSVILGAERAGLISLVLVSMILIAGLRSARAIVAILSGLILGLAATAGLAAMTVGSLNIISAAFAVLFIGLAVDFGVHLSLRYSETRASGLTKTDAIAHAAGFHGTGRPLLYCTVAAMAGFLAFQPTDYLGLAELGIIAALGMAVALILSLTWIPALLAFWPGTSVASSVDGRTEGTGLVRVPLAERYAPHILIATAFMTAPALISLPALSFDVNPLNLRDPGSESVQAFRMLADDPLTTPYRIQAMAETAEAAETLKTELTRVALVGDVISFASFVPENQDEKLDLLFDAQLIFGDTLNRITTQDTFDPALFGSALDELERALAALGGLNAQTLRLLRALEAFQRLHGNDPARMAALDAALTQHLPALLQSLRTALYTQGVSVSDVPEGLREEWVSPDGWHRIDILPAEPITDNTALEAFTQAVASVAPTATGTPVIVTQAAQAVAVAFAQATALSVMAVVILMLALFRNARECCLVIAPLMIAAIWLLGAMAAFGIPLNFANTIALPLLFALGVCGALHMVMRQRQLAEAPPGGPEIALSVEQTSTPRAILISALTTITSFGSLAIAPHPGTASMGVVLTLALGFSLITSLISLPALLHWSAQRWPQRKHSDT